MGLNELAAALYDAMFAAWILLPEAPICVMIEKERPKEGIMNRAIYQYGSKQPPIRFPEARNTRVLHGS